MKCLAITNKGIADIASREIAELISTECTAEDSYVKFEIKEIVDLCRVCYRSQSIIRALLIMSEFDFSSLDDIEKRSDEFDAGGWLKKGIRFAVRCSHEDNYNFSRQNVERSVGGILKERYDLEVDLENPEVLVHVYLTGKHCFIGIDFAGIDLSKRSYFVFLHSTSIKGTIAYALARIAGYENGKVLVDPFSRAGIIPLECAVFASRKAPHYYSKDAFQFNRMHGIDKDSIASMFSEEDAKIREIEGEIIGYDDQLRRVKSAQKNSKIAGIKKNLNFLRGEVDWLDTKFKEGEVDLIITYPPRLSHRTDPKEIKKKAKELFYHSEYVIKDCGKVVLLCNDTEIFENIAEEYGFKINEKRIVYQGQEILNIIVFSKGAK